MSAAWIRRTSLALLLTAAPLLAEEAAPTGLPFPPPLGLTVAAQAALDADPRLKPLRLRCREEYGIVRVWGEVPSKFLADEAVAILKRIQGVNRVQSELKVRAETPREPIVTLPESLSVPAPRDLPGDFRFGQRPKASEDQSRQVDTARPILQPVAPLAKITLGAPRLQNLRPGPELHKLARSVPNNELDRQILLEVERVRLSNNLFRGIDAQVSGGVITLRGSKERWADVVRFGLVVRKLESVRLVEMRTVE